MPVPVPALVVTGFLGAGKTTLLRRLIETSRDKRFAVVVNEFGEEGFDGALIASACDDVVELTNGCVCCRVGEDFVPTLERLVERDQPPDAILIETSGLALPRPVVEAFAFPTLRSKAALAGVVAVVDAGVVAAGGFDAALSRLSGPPAAHHRPSALHGGTDGDDDPVDELYEDQLRAADLVVVSMTDVAGEGALAKLAAALPSDVALRAGARLDPAALLAVAESARADRGFGDPHEDEHDHDDFASIVVDLGVVADRTALAARVAAGMRAHGLLRVKGFVAVAGRPERFTLQATPGATTLAQEGDWNDTPPATRLVVIGPTGFDAATLERQLRETHP